MNILQYLFKLLFTNSAMDKITNIYVGYFGCYSSKSYSQEGEDIVLNRIFEKNTSGFYVDIGSHHPIRFSNTYLLYKKGWHGINVDAMPGSKNLFDTLRPRDINIEAGVSNKREDLTYYAFNESALNGFSREISQKRNKLGKYHIVFTKKIKTTTLADLLEKNMPDNMDIDVMSIDVEGLDFEVIKSNNWDKFRPKLILVEILNSTLEDLSDNKIYAYLLEQNYILYAKLMNTFIFRCCD